MKVKITITEKRNIAVRAVKAEIKRYNLTNLTSGDYWGILDNIARTDKTLIASQFYFTCSDKQYYKFIKECKNIKERS